MYRRGIPIFFFISASPNTDIKDKNNSLIKKRCITLSSMNLCLHSIKNVVDFIKMTLIKIDNVMLNVSTFINYILEVNYSQQMDNRLDNEYNSNRPAAIIFKEIFEEIFQFCLYSL